MENFSTDVLEEALWAITSTLRKSEKAQLKLKAGTFQHSRIVQSIQAYHVAIGLIERELGTDLPEDPVARKYTEEELKEALGAIRSVTGRVEKVQPKFKMGTSQHTLAVRRIKAFTIATALIERELVLLG